MKSSLVVLISLCIILTLAACGNDGYSDNSSSDTGSLSRTLTGDILENIVGRWYRYGNFNGDYLHIWPDMVWEYNRRTDGIMDLYAEGDEIRVGDSQERTV